MVDMKTQKPQGRPPVSKKLRLDRRVPIVVTEGEFAEIKAAADREGITVSAFVASTKVPYSE